jgi:predicted aldo/keto reductase-like oxidoreductase
MQYRRFGRTELQMPVLTCGGMRFQNRWKDDPAEPLDPDNQRNVEDCVRRAVELGINHIETARGYGTSERQLGQVLPSLPRDEILVQTKGGPTENPVQFLANFEKSMANLRVDYLDIFSFHGINTLESLDWVVRPGGCMEAARKLQQDGRIRHIGFSTHGPTDVIVKTIETGQFDSVNFHWFYINPENEPALEAAARHDMGVFIISPNDKGGQLFNPPQKLVDLCAPLSPMVFNDLYCLNRPEIHSLSIGVARPQDFDEHLKAVDQLDQAPTLLPPILERLDQAAVDALGEDWLRNWQEGLPTVDQTPGGLNIPMILRLRNLALAYDMVDFGKFRYNLFGGGGHWFPGHKAEAVNDAELQACLANSPFADQIPQCLRDTHELLGGEDLKRLSESEG